MLTLLLLTTLISPEVVVGRVLDDFHQAASEADETRYFSHFATDAVFIGTDASERWTVKAFREYAHPHFAAGRGWTYTPRERKVVVHGDIAWFDELLDNKKYGVCRGTGVLRRDEGRWRIVQYSLSMPIPNAVASDVVALIRSR